MAGTSTEPASTTGRRPGRDSSSPAPAEVRKGRAPTDVRPLTAYLFLLPYLALFGTFVLAPILYGL
jgi:hypothetical protein